MCVFLDMEAMCSSHVPLEFIEVVISCLLVLNSHVLRVQFGNFHSCIKFCNQQQNQQSFLILKIWT